MSGVGTFDVVGEIGILTIDSPPVNALSADVRAAMIEGLTRFANDLEVRAIVLICAGRTFFAGFDITEFDGPPKEPSLQAVLALIEQSTKPIVAAMHGTALGGGFETALVCHYRVAVPSAKVGLPEVNLGVLPGAGGTQRLPRIVGVPAALEIIIGGKPVGAKKALEYGLVDALAEEGKLREDAIAFAQKILAEGRPLVRVRDREDKILEARGKPEIYADFLKANARTLRGFKAPINIAKAIEAAAELPFDEGMAREAELFEDLVSGTQSAAQRYYFFAERQAGKVPGLSRDIAPRAIAKVGVIGAGTMGGGIAMNFLNAGIPVTLVETSQAALDRGIGVIGKNYANTVAKGRMTQAQFDQRMALITPALDLAALGEADLIIEAVFEELTIKKEIFAKLDAIAKPGAVLASNTSFLDLNAIAAATSRPESVIGLHFFSPANVMRLLEVVRGDKTAPDVVATAMGLGKTIGKVAVLSGVCHGFIANRVLEARGDQAAALVLQGPTPQEIDQALYDYGFAMGHFQMMDLVGLDVLGRDDAKRTLAGDLVKLDRLGQKKNGGFYDYDEKRRATPSPVAAQVIADLAAATGVTPLGALSAEEIVGRLLYPVVNEGAKVLEEGIAIRASDIDVACILGYNWPVYTGGPMFWADTIGLDKVITGLRAMGIEPAKLLVDTAAKGGRLTA